MKKSIIVTVFAVLAVALINPGCSPAKKPTGFTQDTLRGYANDVAVQRAFIDGRWAALQKDPGFRKDAYQESLKENRQMLDDKNIRPQMLKLNLDLMDQTMKDPKQKQRLMASQMDLLEAIAKDPKLRPRLVALITDMMKEPAVKAELRKSAPKVGTVTPSPKLPSPTPPSQPPTGGGPGTTPPASPTPPAAP